MSGRSLFPSLLLAAGFVTGPLLLWQASFDRAVARHLTELPLPVAAAELQALGPEALPAVIAAFAVKDELVPRTEGGPLVIPTMEWLRQRPQPDVIDALIDALDDDSEDVRHFVGLTLAWIGSDAVPALETLLRTAEPALRTAAAYSLSFMGEPGTAALPALQELLEHSDKDVRAMARYAIQQLSPGNEGFWEAVEAER